MATIYLRDTLSVARWRIRTLLSWIVIRIGSDVLRCKHTHARSVVLLGLPSSFAEL